MLDTIIEYYYCKTKISTMGQIEKENKNKNIEQDEVDVKHHLLLPLEGNMFNNFNDMVLHDENEKHYKHHTMCL